MDFQVGGYYHIFNRGNNRGPIFFNSEHYRYFVQQAHRYLTAAGLPIIAHCLMKNHYHLLVHLVKTADVPNVLRAFMCSYVKSINKQLHRTGHLFERYTQVREVRPGSNLLYLLAYIHANPVTARLASHPAHWPFSDYREWASASSDGPPEIAMVRNELVGDGVAYAAFVRGWILARAEGQDPFQPDARRS